jgi:3-oxoacyl-[acyl-carrier protein] reductase
MGSIGSPKYYEGHSLEGKVALITGSGRGIGKGIALELASRGASIVINYANTAKGANETVSDIEALGSKAIAIKADVTKPAEVARMFQEAIAHFGHLDIVISNSGTESFKAEDQITEEDYDKVRTPCPHISQEPKLPKHVSGAVVLSTSNTILTTFVGVQS